MEFWWRGPATLRTYFGYRSGLLWRQLPDKAALNRTGVDDGCRRQDTRPGAQEATNSIRTSRVDPHTPVTAPASTAPLFACSAFPDLRRRRPLLKGSFTIQNGVGQQLRIQTIICRINSTSKAGYFVTSRRISHMLR